jgi:hypothetical protein
MNYFCTFYIHKKRRNGSMQWIHYNYFVSLIFSLSLGIISRQHSHILRCLKIFFSNLIFAFFISTWGWLLLFSGDFIDSIVIVCLKWKNENINLDVSLKVLFQRFEYIYLHAHNFTLQNCRLKVGLPLFFLCEFYCLYVLDVMQICKQYIYRKWKAGFKIKKKKWACMFLLYNNYHSKVII